MSGQQEVTQILDLGTGMDQQPPQLAVKSGADTGAFNSSVNSALGSFPATSTGFQPVASQVVTHEVAYSPGLRGKFEANKILIIFSAVAVTLAGLLMFSPISVDELMVSLGLSEPEMQLPKVPPRKVAKAPEPAKPAPVAPIAPSTAKDDNVWSVIENDWGDELLELAPPLTSDQETMLKDKMSHRFVYQHYVGVLELSALRAKGSEELLRGGLESKKFWTRMRALIGLADMGQEISPEDVKLALGDAHSELRARFFKRFEKSPCTLGCFYVARASLPYLDEPGRSQALKVISREDSDIRDLFMVAATYDKSDMVRATAEEWLSRHSVEASIRDNVKAAVRR